MQAMPTVGMQCWNTGFDGPPSPVPPVLGIPIGGLLEFAVVVVLFGAGVGPDAGLGDGVCTAPVVVETGGFVFQMTNGCPNDCPNGCSWG